MSKIKLDELLKEELGNFSAEVPADVWQNISQQLPVSPASTIAGQQITGKIATKTAMATVKGVILTTVAVSAIGVAVWQLAKAPEVAQIKPNVTPEKEQVVHEESPSSAIAIPEAEPKTQNEAMPRSMINALQPNGQSTSRQEPLSISHEHDLKAENDHSQMPQADLMGISHKNGYENATTIKPIESESESNNNTTLQHNHVQQAAHEIESQKIFIPDVITPNGDGINDQLVIEVENELIFDLKITDKQGKLIFESKAKQPFWNGTHQNTGAPCLPGLYILVLRYQTKGMPEAKVETQKIWVKL